LSRWFWAQERYAKLEAAKLLTAGSKGERAKATSIEGTERGDQRAEIRSQRSGFGNQRSAADDQRLSPQDRVRKWIVVAPVLVFFYTLFAKRLILDGWPGWYYVFQRTLAELLLSLRLIEARIGIGDQDLGERNVLRSGQSEI